MIIREEIACGNSPEEIDAAGTALRDVIARKLVVELRVLLGVLPLVISVGKPFRNLGNLAIECEYTQGDEGG